MDNLDPSPAPEGEKIVAIDPSYTCTGAAVYVNGLPVSWGKLKFKTGKKKGSKAARRAELREWLRPMIKGASIVVTEQLWTQPGASIIAAVADVCLEEGLDLQAYHSRAWKKRILGDANGDKAAAIVKASEIVGATVQDDNEADAVCIGRAAIDYPDMLRKAE